MKGGRLKQKITIQRRASASPDRNPEGDLDQSWSDYLTDVSAEWVTLDGRSLFTAQQHHAEVQGIWRMRWRSGITHEMRIVHDGRYYDILYVPPRDRDGREWQMDLECSQGVNVEGA